MSLLARSDPVAVAPVRWWSRPLTGVGLPLLLGLVHAALVAPHYFVGSFDDDAGYILTARALLDGRGLTGHIASGGVLVGLYPPGFSALLAPLLWLWPNTFAPLRLFSLACFAAVFILTWIYLERRRFHPGARIAVLTLLALGPPFATYATMVMAETPYLVVFLLLLLALDRWESQARIATWAGFAAVVSSAALVWLKQAGLGAIAGAVLWLALQGRIGRRKAALLAAGVAVSLLPVLIARVSTGTPIAGSRYSEELGGFYQGGLASRLVHVVPHSAWHLLSTAIPATLVPYLSPLPIHGRWPDLFQALSWLITGLVIIGGVQWWRHHRDAAIAIVPVYLAEAVLWPYVNERRAILVLPVLAAWFVLGAIAVWNSARAFARGTRWASMVRPVAVTLTAAVVVVPLLVQAPRDYLYSIGQNSSHFQGSPYVQMLSELGVPSDVVETDYQYATALFTGHRTAWTAFEVSQTGCDPTTIAAALAVDHAAYLLLGDVNKPGVMDRPCLLSLAQQGTWAVQLLHTDHDDAYVFELLGPGTGNPGLADLTNTATHSTTSSSNTTIEEWRWARPQQLTQVSLSEASLGRSTGSVHFDVQGANGQWVTVAQASSAVGDQPGDAPFLLASFKGLEPVDAVRVVLTSSGPAGPVTLEDVHALGPALPG